MRKTKGHDENVDLHQNRWNYPPKMSLNGSKSPTRPIIDNNEVQAWLYWTVLTIMVLFLITTPINELKQQTNSQFELSVNEPTVRL